MAKILTYGDLPTELIDLIVDSPKFPDWVKKCEARQEAALEQLRQKADVDIAEVMKNIKV